MEPAPGREHSTSGSLIASSVAGAGLANALRNAGVELLDDGLRLVPKGEAGALKALWNDLWKDSRNPQKSQSIGIWRATPDDDEHYTYAIALR